MTDAGSARGAGALIGTLWILRLTRSTLDVRVDGKPLAWPRRQLMIRFLVNFRDDNLQVLR